jgi:glutamate carboxypeptidase
MTPTPDQIETYYRNHLDRYLETLRKMVLINSFTDNPAGVNKLGELTAALFAELGFQAEFIQSDNPEFGKHAFLKRTSSPGDPERPTIAMISHLDTVFSPDEEEQNDFTWRPEGKRIYGPGTVDIKGGTLLIYMLLEGFQRLAPEAFDSTDWIVALDAAEERLSEDFGVQCLERLPDATRACLVFEGGTISSHGFPLVVGRKGRATYRVAVKGRSAHAGNAHFQGANAILQLAHTIQQIASLTDYAQDLTFNVGVVRGGSVVNRVPHYAEVEVEMRAFDPQVFQSGIDSMLALDGGSQVSSADGYPCSVEVQLGRQMMPWPRNPGSDRLLACWTAAGEQFGLRAIPEQRGGLSDGNNLWEHFPTIDGLGPSGGNAHCSERSPDGNLDQEYLLVNSIVPKATLNMLAVLKLLESEG